MAASHSRSLTPKQQRLVAAYLIGLEATQAAIRAGYSPNDADVTRPRSVGNGGVAAVFPGGPVNTIDELDATQGACLASVEISEKNAAARLADRLIEQPVVAR